MQSTNKLTSASKVHQLDLLLGLIWGRGGKSAKPLPHLISLLKKPQAPQANFIHSLPPRLVVQAIQVLLPRESSARCTCLSFLTTQFSSLFFQISAKTCLFQEALQDAPQKTVPASGYFLSCLCFVSVSLSLQGHSVGQESHVQEGLHPLGQG